LPQGIRSNEAEGIGTKFCNANSGDYHIEYIESVPGCATLFQNAMPYESGGNPHELGTCAAHLVRSCISGSRIPATCVRLELTSILRPTGCLGIRWSCSCISWRSLKRHRHRMHILFQVHTDIGNNFLETLSVIPVCSIGLAYAIWHCAYAVDFFLFDMLPIERVLHSGIG
jgi:hypothetical protein